MAVNPTLLIDLIYRACRKQGLLLPQITRLVKLMYLTELEYFRIKGERLTGLRWKFYLYGPYPLGLESALGAPEIEEHEWTTGQSSREILRDEDTYMRASADADLERIIASLVKEWGDADLNQLLDYVYFETEPMQGATRGEDLDFSAARPRKPKVRIVLDRSRLKALRKRVSERAKAYGELRRVARPAAVRPKAAAGLMLHVALRGTREPSAELEEGLKVWDEEERTLFPSGPCKILLDDLIPEE